MAVFKYAPVPTSEAHGSPGVEMGGVGRRGTGAAVSSRASPSGHHAGGDGDDLVTKRMPYCLGMLVLLAIIYVLSRSEVAQKQQLVQGGDCIADLDIGAYRAKQLANMPPHIIECKEAGEGGAQDACHLPRNKRYAAVGQKGATLWMTGLSGSGKSTIAKALEEELVLRHGVHVYRLDGDNIRTGLNRDLGFSADDRAESVRRVGEMSCLFSDSGTITLVSLVSPYRDDRDEVRRRHEDQGIPFFEIFMDVPLDVVQDRDPKGLYKQVEEGKIKGFTGVDAPYEAPLKAELVLPNYEMTVDECVQALMRLLQAAGILDGSMPDPTGLPMPDGDEVVDLLVPSTLRSSRQEEAASLPKVPLTDIDLNWLQTIGEGWASPLRGFMREGVLLQSLHFASYLVDPHNVTSEAGLYSKPTDFAHLPANRPPDRVSMSVPITLAITEYTKAAIEGSGKKAVALTTKDGATVAILRRPEIYANRKEEIVTRTFGVIDPGHPYIANIYSGGEWLIGGEVELIEPIKFFDGLDKWRLSARELREELAMKGADVVYAFQTRNPTHAGHAYLMRTAGERLKAQGYTRPVLWLSPLGGWTKEDDVPLDVRVKQHEAVLDAGMLDPDSTVMAIWPAPMIYGGPTEVQFHAKSRRCGGASFFVVGRDPAGMKGSELAEAHPDDDLYDPEHGRYVLAMSPGVGNMKMLDFEQVYYDKVGE
jgi:3'-phosphoadenosine 5'-phosphosulfate synthase